MSEPKQPQPMILTVVIYDGTPVRWLNEPCSHRTVHLMLTAEQCDAIALRENEGYGQTYVEHIRQAEIHCSRDGVPPVTAPAAKEENRT